MKIKIKKYAYIFDYTKYHAYTEREKCIYEYLRNLYNSETDREKWIDAENLGASGYAINLYGELHYLNDIQIAATDEPDSIINHRKNPSKENITELLSGKDFTIRKHYDESFLIYSNKFQSFNVEVLTDPGDLGYICAHFNGASNCFIIDDRSGILYDSGEWQHHRKTDEKEIVRQLGIRSERAKKEFRAILEALRNA